ncbi:MAG: F0F1 ATP synthase subunit B [Acidimicrobiales bacterium]|jgi:F-type H+-transporting ATPase subunit b|nr:F0F1 ATP synthase subunit B [Acidimicrobiales bacterium]
MLETFLIAAEEPNKELLPGDVNEAIWATIAFIIVFGLLLWKGGPPAKQAFVGRTERIAKELGDAEAARTDAAGALGDVETRIANAENERQRILVEARQTADALRQQLIAKAEQDAADLKARAAADIESAKSQAVADLQAEVGGLALGAAEQVIARNLDQATQDRLIEQYIQQVGVTR